MAGRGGLTFSLREKSKDFFLRPVERKQVVSELKNKAEAELGRGLGAQGGQRSCRSALGRQSYPAGVMGGGQ